MYWGRGGRSHAIAKKSDLSVKRQEEKKWAQAQAANHTRSVFRLIFRNFINVQAVDVFLLSCSR